LRSGLQADRQAALQRDASARGLPSGALRSARGSPHGWQEHLRRRVDQVLALPERQALHLSEAAALVRRWGGTPPAQGAT